MSASPQPLAAAGAARRPAAWLLGLAVLVAGCFVLDISLGSVRIPPGAGVRILFARAAEPGLWVFIVN